MLTLAVCLFCIIPYEAAIKDHFDVCHVQHYYDNEGQHVFSQLLWKQWNPHENRHDIEAWRLIKNGEPKPMDGGVIFHDMGTLRHVKADQFYETWDQFDMELEHRQLKAKECRRELTAPIKRK